MEILVIWGSILLIVSLALAWLATLVRIVGVPSLKKRFPNSQHLVRAHIDFLLMSLLLFAFFLLLDSIPTALVVLMLVGATVNPSLFIVMAMDEPPGKKPGPFIGGIAGLSFVCTTLGFGGAAVLLLMAHI